MFDVLVFYIFSAVLVIASLAVVLVRNPVYSVLLLIFTFLNAAAIFILLKAEFIAMVLVIVYVGAVAVLFLFVVMLINMQTQEKRKIFTKYTIFSIVLLIILGLELTLFFAKDADAITFTVVNKNFYNSSTFVAHLGEILFNNYFYVFLVSSAILTVAMIGAVVIVGRDDATSGHIQDVFLQNIRSKETTVYGINMEREKGIK